MIRRATYDDLPAVYELGLKLKRLSPYVTVPIDKEVAMKTLRQCLTGNNGVIYVHVINGSVVGVIVGISEQLWYSTKRFATDLLFYSIRGGGGAHLVDAFLHWAWAQPAVVDVTMGVTSGRHIRVSDRWFREQGFARVGGMYQMGRFDWTKRQESAA